MESKLQSRIISDLRDKGYIALKVIRCNLNGWPDVTCYKNRRAVFIEIKDEGEKADPLQKFRHDELRREGFQVYVVDTWEDYRKLRL